MQTLQVEQEWLSKVFNQEGVILSQESTRNPDMTSKKKFSYEYDMGTEAILKSLLGKSYATPKDYQRLFDTLIQKTYEKTKGKAINWDSEQRKQ